MGNTTAEKLHADKGLGVAGGKRPYRGKRKGYRQERLFLSLSGGDRVSARECPLL